MFDTRKINFREESEETRSSLGVESRDLNTNTRDRSDTALLLADSKMEFVQMARVWIAAWKAVLQKKSLLGDLLAGVTVATVALPLNVALAVACGLPATIGVVSGIIGGAVAAFFGSSSFQVTGPAAALSFLIFGIQKEFGVLGLAVSCIIIGLSQIGFGFFGAGKLSKMVPKSVLTGFTTGVGLKILDSQIPDFLGYDSTVPDLTDMMQRSHWLHEVSWIAVFCGLFVSAVMTATKDKKKFPGALFGIVVVTAISVQLDWNLATVGKIPEELFSFSIPIVSDEKWLGLFLQTIPLAFLASVESLLSGIVLSKTTHSENEFNPNLELFGQGLANFFVGFFGGMPVSGVVIRSIVNVHSGAKTRLASLFHTLIMFLSTVFLGKYLSQVPLSALAGLLCVVGYRLVDLDAFIHLCKKERVGALAFLVTMVGTLSHHLIEGLLIGIVLQTSYEFFSKSRNGTESKTLTHSNRIRAVVKAQEEGMRRPEHWLESRPPHHNWLVQIQEKSFSTKTSFIHGKASMIGRVVLGDNVHIAPESSVRADEGTPFYIGSNSNIQDGAVLHALKDRWISVGSEEWAIFIGKNVSVAHQALVHGPSFIGNNTFIGFKAIVHDSVVGAHCYIGIGAIVVGVEIPEGRYVPHGMILDSQEKVKTLGAVSDAQNHFNEDVVEVNRGLAEAYLQEREMGQKRGAALKEDLRTSSYLGSLRNPNAGERF